MDQATPRSGNRGGKLFPWSHALDVPRGRSQTEGCARGSGERSKDSNGPMEVPMDGPTVMPPTSSWMV